jgi:RNA polymerase sigma factor (TIGR02999 family)
MSDSSAKVTLLLNKVVEGDRAASEQLLPLVYDELRKLARIRMSKLPPGQTLQSTALVHEAYLRTADQGDGTWEGRRHFFFVAARAMRDILVEDARRKSSIKRGGDKVRVELGIAFEVAAPAEKMLDLDIGLQKLEKLDPQGFELVMLRYFTGFSLNEVAQAWGTSLSTVERKWRFVKTWLADEMET